jgi:hypothetical protein
LENKSQMLNIEDDDDDMADLAREKMDDLAENKS